MTVLLFAPQSYHNATPRMIAEICNGCGAKGIGGYLVPDTLYGLNVSPVCDIHDWMYHEGSTLPDKDAADRVMYNNMIRYIDAYSCWALKWLRTRRAMKYYLAVKYFGGGAYWADKNAPSDYVSTAYVFLDSEHG